jgi:hypothetical protein
VAKHRDKIDAYMQAKRADGDTTSTSAPTQPARELWRLHPLIGHPA